MYIDSKVYWKENTNVTSLKLLQKPTKIGEDVKTCTAINVSLFLFFKGSFVQSLEPFTLKDDLYKYLLYLQRCY